MREMVFAAKPGLRQLVVEQGDMPVLSYALSRQVVPVVGERQQECLRVMVQYANAVWGPEVATSVEASLRADWYVSTAEHHAPVSHPFVVSGTFVQSLVQQRRGLNAMVVLSSSTISLNNSSFPRGFVHHGAELAEGRVSFLPWKLRRQPVIGLPAGTAEQYVQVIEEAKKTDERLADFFIRLQPAWLSAESYAEQIAVLNRAFWRQLPGQEHMHLAYMPQEVLTKELLLQGHLQKTTVVSQVLFSPVWRAAYARLFTGLAGAHSANGEHGTFLFWAIKDGLRLPLRVVESVLESVDLSYQVPLTPEAIGGALERGELVPSMALSLVVLCFYYGLSCGGGFSQVDYLPQLAAAWQALLGEQGVVDEPAFGVTQYMSADYAFVSLQATRQSALATGLDMFLYGEESTRARLKELSETVTLSQALDNLLPEFYAIVKGGKLTTPIMSSPLPTCLYVPMPLLR